MTRQHVFTKTKLLALTAMVYGLSVASSAKASSAVFERTLLSATWVISPIGKDNSSFGTGALVDLERRLVVTNFHVVDKRPNVVVFFPAFENGQVITEPKYYIENGNKLGIRGKVIHSDTAHDLAVIELESVPSGVRPISIARQGVRPGQVVHAIGNSGVNDGTLWRYSKGEVRSVYQRKAKTLYGKGQEIDLDSKVVESQIPSNQGDSGGPLVNDRGELVAVTQGNKPQEQLISFGIELSEIVKVLTSLGSVAATQPAREEQVVKQTPAIEPEDLPVDEAPVQKPARPVAPAKKPAAKQTVVVQRAPKCYSGSSCSKR